MFARIVGSIIYKMRKCGDYFVRKYITAQFSSVGKDVYIGKNGIFTYKNITIGNDVYIGANAVFQSSYGKIVIGSHVMFGPGVHIHGGNHKIHEIGELLKHTSQKKQGDDGVVTIEDDCWIGANAIILNNVVIGKGSVIGAGSVVTKDVPPYSIYTGSPGMKLRDRFSSDSLKVHEQLLNAKSINGI